MGHLACNLDPRTHSVLILENWVRDLASKTLRCGWSSGEVN